MKITPVLLAILMVACTGQTPVQFRSSAYLYLPTVTKLHKELPAPSTKKGVDAPRECRDASILRVAWYYDWSTRPMLCAGYEAVPMIWGRDYIDNPLVGNSPYALLFNEPDLCPQQACLSVDEAVELAHIVFMRHPDRKWISPVTSQLHPDWLTAWYTRYTDRYGPPPIVGMAVHCYGIAAEDCITYIQARVTEASNWGLSEVWVTEWAYPLTTERTFDQSIMDMRTTLDYFESTPMIKRYAWYMSRDDGSGPTGGYALATPLLTFNAGELTNWGEIYRDY